MDNMIPNSESRSSEQDTWPTQELRLADLIPEEWGFRAGNANLWLSCYRVFLMQKDHIAEHTPLKGDVLGCRLVFLLGAPKYWHGGTFRIAPWDAVRPLTFISEDHKEIQAELGTYLMIFAPYPQDASPDTELVVKRSISATVALVRTTMGRNAAFDLLFDNIIRADGKVTARTTGLLDPRSVSAPDVTPAAMTDIESVAKLALKHDSSSRLMLALRWLNDGMERAGVDSFVSLWIALETLGMPDGNNISQLVQALASVYNVPMEVAKDRFMVGRLAGLRSKIVHDGHQPIIGGLILVYTRALFIDILRHLVEADPIKQAGQILEASRGAVEDAIDQALAAG